MRFSKHLHLLGSKCTALACFILASCVAHADIYQWEYVNPVDPSQGKIQSNILCVGGAGVVVGPNTTWGNGADLTKAYLIGANLSSLKTQGALPTLDEADFSQATLTDAYLYAFANKATFKGANFFHATVDGDIVEGDFTEANLTEAHIGQFLDYGPKSFSHSVFVRANLANSYLENVDLTGANFNGASLTKAHLDQVDLTDASFAGADLSGAYLRGSPTSFVTLVRTDFSGANLTNTFIEDNQVSQINLSGADMRGMSFPSDNVKNKILNRAFENSIRPFGMVEGLDLTDAKSLNIHDYDGNPERPLGALPPIPISVRKQATMDSTGTLRLLFEEDAWDSLISFEPGIAVTLGGTLELRFQPDVNLGSQVGRTFHIFDWTNVSPTGQFQIVSPYAWDVSQLYTAGEVTLVPEPATLALSVIATLYGLANMRRPKKVSGTHTCSARRLRCPISPCAMTFDRAGEIERGN